MAKMNTNMNKKQMRDWIYRLGFCADDMQLYLDTHYNDQEAIEYFNQCNELLSKARMEYQQKYGALLIGERQTDNEWDWNKGMVPWEGDCD